MTGVAGDTYKTQNDSRAAQGALTGTRSCSGRETGVGGDEGVCWGLGRRGVGVLI